MKSLPFLPSFAFFSCENLHLMMLDNSINQIKAGHKRKPVLRKKKILNHMDRIAFPGGVIYVFKFPILRRAIEKKVEENAQMNKGIAEDLQKA